MSKPSIYDRFFNLIQRRIAEQAATEHWVREADDTPASVRLLNKYPGISGLVDVPTTFGSEAEATLFWHTHCLPGMVGNPLPRWLAARVVAEPSPLGEWDE